MNDIAANIKRLRKEKGLSQEQFAQALHVTRQTVSAWERGLSRPALESLQQMAQVLGVELEQLIYGEKAGKRLRYRSVPFGMVFGIVPLFLFVVCWLFPMLGSVLMGGNSELYILTLPMGGMLFLAIQIMVCYWSLKDEIRNRDYYEKMEPEEQLED